MTDAELAAIAADYACVPKRQTDGSVVTTAQHDKCYENATMTRWICRKCKTRGVDSAAVVSIDNEYDRLAGKSP